MTEELKVVQYHTTMGSRVALLVSVGPKWLKYIDVDSSGMRIKTAPADHVRSMVDLPCPIAKAKRQFLRLARKYNGGLRGCSTALRGVLE